LGRDPLLGEVFIFMNRSCTSVKLLHWERGGLVLYHKRLEKGRFSLPVFDETSRYYHLSWRDLVLMVEGISPEKVRHKKRFENIAETAVKLQHFFVISDKFALSLQRF
jgi:transposase